eukprot:3763730-Karenia_brevis.AAC.1
MQGCLMCHGFIYRKVFLKATSPPFDLAIGDIKANLARLGAETEPPEEPTSKKIWTLYRSMAISRDLLEQAVRMMQFISWVSVCVEQAHASLACLKKFHPHIEMSLLLARGFIHQMRDLLLPEKEDAKLKVLSRRVSILHNFMPQKARGQGLWVSECKEKVLEQMHPAKLTKEESHRVFSFAM